MCRAEGCSKARDAHLQGSAPCGADMRKPATTRGCMEKSVESAVAKLGTRFPHEGSFQASSQFLDDGCGSLDIVR